MVELATTPESFSRFLTLATEYEESLPLDLRHAEWLDERDRIAEAYGAPNAAFVAITDGHAAGIVAFRRHDATSVVVKKMYVSPVARGHGVARALMYALSREASARGHTRLLLDTDKHQLRPAYELYLSLGFHECEPYAKTDYAAVFMELPLAPD